MKRITTNDDIRFPIRVVKGLDSDVFTIQFYTTSKAVNITKTNEDVVDGIIHLEWNELYPLGTGVMNYTVLIPEEDGSYSDDTFNKSISGTTIFYIVSDIIVPDGDDAQNLIELVAELDTKLDAEIARSTGKDSEHDTAIAGKADKNGSISESFNTYTLNLRREGANTSLYNYNLNGEEYVSFYDQTGGSLTYHFTPNQSDDIATVRQLNTKANISDVYTKEQADLLINSSEGLLEEPTEKIPKYSTAHPIRILGIGNSYMTEGTRELEGFLTAEGLTEDELDLEIAYYPARTLEAWYEAIRDGGGYEQLVQFKYNSGNHKWYRTAEHNVANIRDTISGKAWDLIVLQEFPSFSNDNPNASEYYSYHETLSSVIALCKSLCPNSQVEFGWHMIWSNDQYIANNYMVWEKICDASKRTAKLSDVSFIIPSATALQNAYNTSYFRGYEHHFLLMDQIGHPAAGAARYIISATWFESLIAPIFGRSLIGNGYVPSFISDGTVTYQDAEVEVNSGNVLLAKLCAISSILDKYDVNYELEKKLNLYYTKSQTDTLLGNKANTSDVYTKGEVDTALTGKANTSDVYTKGEVDTALSGKANKNGSSSQSFTANAFNLQKDGASTTLYNYKDANNREFVSFYDQTGGSLTYQFTANQGDNIATERQLTLKANSADVYSKTETYTKSEVENLIPELPDNIVTDESYVHTDNNFTTTLKNKLDGIASGAEVNVQANWNETNSSSDAYIQNKPTIPTVDSSITGSSQTNAVQGGAIYTALSEKAEYKEYSTLQDMEADSPANGTIGYDGDEEIFYIFDSPNGEWRKIENAPIVNSITSGSPNAVQGGTIYTALAGKAGYRWYSSYNNMIADRPANGTIGYDSTNKNFYIYDSSNSTWKPIDQTGGSGDGKQRTYLKAIKTGGTVSFKDSNNTALSLQQSIDVLNDLDKEVIIDYNDKLYYPIGINDEVGEYYEWQFIYLNTTTIFTFDLDYTYEEGMEDDAINCTASSKALPSIASLGFGYMSTTATSTSTTVYATTLSAYTYVNGGIVVVKFGLDVGANATLNINGKGNKPIYYQGGAITAGVIKNGYTAALVFNNTNNRFDLICTDHVPTKTSDLTNDSNFVDATNNQNEINATTVKFFDGVDNYVTISGDYDQEFDCNTLRFTDLFSGNEALFSMAPRGYRLNLGDYRNNLTSLPSAVNGVITVPVVAGYNLIPLRWINTTNTINFTFATPSYYSKVVPIAYIYIVGTTNTIRCTGITFNMDSSVGVTSVLWKDGAAPNIVSDMQASSVKMDCLIKLTHLGNGTVLAEYSYFKAAT